MPNASTLRSITLRAPSQGRDRLSVGNSPTTALDDRRHDGLSLYRVDVVDHDRSTFARGL